MSDLLNCPFCGGGNVRAQQNGQRRDGSFSWWEVVCDDCDIVAAPFDDGPEAIYAWNRRAPVPLPVDALEPTPGAIDLLCLSVQDVINGRLETGDADGGAMDIVERLRVESASYNMMRQDMTRSLGEAADEIERLRADLAAVKEHLDTALKLTEFDGEAVE